MTAIWNLNGFIWLEIVYENQTKESAKGGRFFERIKKEN
jgi:hypothetical protein